MNNNELMSRRHFFQKAAKGMLPMLGAIVVGPSIVMSAMTSCDNCGACEAACQDNCENTCTGSCSGACLGGCSGSCSGGCEDGCTRSNANSGGCSDCSSSCSGSCSTGCSSTCTGSAQGTPNEQDYTIYVKDETGWPSLYLYMWGDKELNGGWPGRQISSSKVINGTTWKYIVYGSECKGLNPYCWYQVL